MDNSAANTAALIVGVCSVIALIGGPVLAVAITLWAQRRAQEFGARERLFVTIMAHRKLTPPSIELVNSLNLIHVVYAKHPKVRQCWQHLYSSLCQKPLVEQEVSHNHLNLLSAMADSLGYKDLPQTSIDQLYSPQGHADQAQLVQTMQTEFVRVLKATKNLDSITDG